MKITSLEELKSKLKDTDNLFLLLYKPESEQSECAKQRIQALKDSSKSYVAYVDVSSVRDIHPEYGIDTAPSLLEFRNGKLANVYKGCQTEDFYESAISGSGFTSPEVKNDKPVKRVTVYSTPTCTWCNTLKTYLKEHNIPFTDVNVAADQVRAEEMVRKSGQQGVPQTDINGQIVVGFDKNRINRLLEISA